MNQDLIYQIALTLVKGIGNITAKQVVEHLGDVGLLFKEKANRLERIPGISSRIIAEIRKASVMHRAEKEVAFIEKNKIRPLFISNKDYPQRFKECIDSPAMLYFKGNADLNAAKIVSIVGTRHNTSYGKEVTEQLIDGFSKSDPDILVVSGLAYGIDVIAHKAALKNKLSTIGVLAHGLDRIYPLEHRNIAVEMLEQGGLLSDFMSETNPDRPNFVKRNRIVAGIADCTIVIESANKGGALITAGIADSYNKDVFVVPGRINDNYSRGCNKLIKDKKAALIENAEDVLKEMAWAKFPKEKAKQAVQRTIFLDLSPEQQLVTDILSKANGMHLNLLAIESNMPVSKLAVVLFDLEMSGVVNAFPGGIYRLV